jgi:hypothetical protein
VILIKICANVYQFLIAMQIFKKNIWLYTFVGGVLWAGVTLQVSNDIK